MSGNADKKKQKKRTFGRHRYLNDFVRNSTGEYVYMGKHVHWDQDRRGLLTRLWVLTCMEAILAVLCGCMPKAGMEQRFYVLIPYLLMFLSVFVQLWKMVDLSFSGKNVRDYVYNRTVPVLNVTPWITMGTGAATAVAEIIRSMEKEFANYGWMLVFALLITIVCVCAGFFHLFTNKDEFFHKK